MSHKHPLDYLEIYFRWIWVQWSHHGRWRQIWQSRKCIRNAFGMFKYGNLFAMAANSFGNLKFMITFVHNTKVKHKLRICHEYKSEALVDNKDLHAMQIPNLAKQFLAPTYLLSNSKFVHELAVPVNWFAYLNVTNALRMYLRGLQVWRRLPWRGPWSSLICKWEICIFLGRKLAISKWEIAYFEPSRWPKRAKP